MVGLRDKAAIVGIGETEYSRNSGMSNVALLMQAAARAIADAGLSPKDVDGVMSGIRGALAEDFISNLGIEDACYTATVHMGGASAVASLQSAAMAVATGVATSVICVTGWNGYSERGIGRGQRQPPGTSPMAIHLNDFEVPFGALTPAHWYSPNGKKTHA